MSSAFGSLTVQDTSKSVDFACNCSRTRELDQRWRRNVNLTLRPMPCPKQEINAARSSSLTFPYPYPHPHPFFVLIPFHVTYRAVSSPKFTSPKVSLSFSVCLRGGRGRTVLARLLSVARVQLVAKSSIASSPSGSRGSLSELGRSPALRIQFCCDYSPG